jgi:hypothetical protein
MHFVMLRLKSYSIGCIDSAKERLLSTMNRTFRWTKPIKVSQVRERVNPLKSSATKYTTTLARSTAWPNPSANWFLKCWLLNQDRNTLYFNYLYLQEVCRNIEIIIQCIFSDKPLLEVHTKSFVLTIKLFRFNSIAIRVWFEIDSR